MVDEQAGNGRDGERPHVGKGHLHAHEGGRVLVAKALGREVDHLRVDGRASQTDEEEAAARENLSGCQDEQGDARRCQILAQALELHRGSGSWTSPLVMAILTIALGAFLLFFAFSAMKAAVMVIGGIFVYNGASNLWIESRYRKMGK